MESGVKGVTTSDLREAKILGERGSSARFAERLLVACLHELRA